MSHIVHVNNINLINKRQIKLWSYIKNQQDKEDAIKKL